MNEIEAMFQISLNDDLSLRLASPTDTIAVYQLIDQNRDYLSEYLPWFKNATFDGVKSFLIKANESFMSGTMFEYVIVKKTKIVGSVNLFDIDKRARSGELGYWLAKEYKHQGIMNRSVKGLVKVAENVLNLHRFIIRTAPDNYSSQKVAINAGFSYEGLRHEDFMWDGRFFDSEVFYYLSSL